jgi:hypothetical protein
VDDMMAIDILDTSHDALPELLLGCHADVTQDRAGKLREEALLRLSQEPCTGVKVNSKRPAGRVASQLLVSFEI